MGEENKDLAAKVAELTAQVAEKEEVIKAQHESIQNAKETGIVATIVEGKFKISVEGPEGKKTLKLVMKPGRVRLPLNDGRQVPAECVIRLYNGGKIKPEEVAKCPPLEGMTKEDAVALLTRYVEMGASYFQAVK